MSARIISFFTPLACQLLLRLGLSLMIYTLCRLFFIHINAAHLPAGAISALWGGLRFDTAALIYINSLLIISYLLPVSWRALAAYRWAQRAWFLLTHIAIMGLEVGDAFYFKYAFRRIVSSDLALLRNSAHLLPLFLAEYGHWLLAGGVVIFVMYKLYNATTLRPYPTVEQARFSWQGLGVMLVGIGLSIIGLRGGLQLRPLTNITAQRYVHDPALAPAVTNATLSLIFSMQQRQLTEKNMLPTAEAALLYPICRESSDTAGAFRPLHVVIIALESFGKEYTGFYNRKPYTPFLDSLLASGWQSSESFANGLRSTQGIVSITSGLPNLMEDPFMFSAYQTNHLTGLAGYLGKKNYQTAFFHGANAGSMEFETFAKATGFTHYFDRRHYGLTQNYDGNWGVWDIPFFQYTATQLDSFARNGTPFYAFLFSLTSHHPYAVETWFAEQYPQEEPLYRSVRYTNEALRRFFATVRTKEWFENTLFVITADHVGASSEAQFQTKVGRYAVPILFYHAGKIMPTASHRLVQHADILPSVLDYLQYDLPYAAAGRSIWQPTPVPAILNYESGEYVVITPDRAFTYDGSAVTTHWQRSELHLRDASAPVPDSLLHYLQAGVQRYNHALLRNAWRCE